MPKIRLSPVIAGIQGTVGNLVFFREGDTTYLRTKAERTQPMTQAQLAQIDRLGTASRWAKQVLLDPVTKAAYKRACHDHLTPHNVAVADYLNAPVIESIRLDSYAGKAGDVIRIAAGDDFNITRLGVVIRTVGNAERKTLEEGAAERDMDGKQWLYTSRTEVLPGTMILIEATAVDLPGNQAKANAFYYVENEQQ